MVAYWTCISMPNANLDSCAGTFAINSNGGDMTGASKANELAGCMADCENRCKGGDAG